MNKSIDRDVEEKRSLSFFGMKFNLAYFGLCFSFCWCFGITKFSPAEVNQILQGTMYIGVALGCILFAVLAKIRGTNIVTAKGLQAVLPLMAAAFSFVLVLPNDFLGSEVFVIALGLFSGMLIGWQYLLWGSFYRKLDIRPAIAILFGTVIFAAAIKILIALFHPSVVNTVIYASFPIISIILWRVATKNVPVSQYNSKRYNFKSLLSLKSIALGISVFSFAIGLLITFADATTFNMPYLALAQILTVIVCIPLMVMAYYRQEDFDFSTIWFIVLLAIAAGTIFAEYPIPGIENLFIAVFTAAHMFVVAFVWLVLADVSHNSVYPSDVIFGFGWPLYALPIGVALTFADLFSSGVDDFRSSLIILLILMVVLYLFMRERQPHDLKLFNDLNPPFSSDRISQLTEQVDKLASTYGISDREKTVILLYAQGRSRSFISSRLYISDNTVRDHIKSVYKKMGIHNKQDLIDRIEGIT